MSWFLAFVLVCAAGFLAGRFYSRVWTPLSRCLDRVRKMAGLPPMSLAPPRLERLTRELESSILAAEINVDVLQKRLSHGDFSQQAVLGSMIEGVMIADTSSRFLLVNDAFGELFGQKQGLIGMTVLSALRNSTIHEAVRSALEGGIVMDLEIEDAAAPGRTFLMNAHPIPDERGQAIGVVAVFRDHTRLKRLERSRREFVENVSHELRTPLSIIQGYLETILEGPNLTRREIDGFLATAKKHSDRLTDLVTDLLTISRLEAAEASPADASGVEPPSCDVGEIVEKAVSDLRRIATRKKIEVGTHLGAALKPAAIETAKLEQVLFNLLDNAIKYTPEGGRVSVEVSEAGGDTVVCVADTGRGIPESSLPHVFERFFRVERARSRDDGGTGLGLSIVKHIVQAHGGRVWAESRVGEGSKFYFTLKPAAGS